MRAARQLVWACAALITACASTAPPHKVVTPVTPAPAPIAPGVDPDLPVLPAAGSGRGAYYQDDGPGENPPPGLKDVPDAQPKIEPVPQRTRRPYTVFGKTYTPISNGEPFIQTGTGSWYGKKFHGQRTASGELYDMYKMTAAHPTLPVPSYARVTNVATGKQVIVRINDRGPFHSGRIIDVSFTAALKLGLLGKGSREVTVEHLLPDEIVRMASARAQAQPGVADAPGPVPRTDVVAQPVRSETQVPADVLALMQDSAGKAARVQLPGSAAPAAAGFYLQLGAFGRAENAEAARARVAQAMRALSRVEVVLAGSVHRLLCGPFTSRADALRAALALPSDLKSNPIVVRR